MTAHDASLFRGGLFRWLGFGPAHETPPDIPGGLGEASSEPMEPLELRRRNLLTDIASFLIAYRLDVTNFTLSVANDLLTGADPALERHVAQRVDEGQPITVEWLEDIAKSHASDGSEQFAALVVKLEATISEFASTASAARSATSNYNEALETHVGDLGAVGDASSVIIELATLARDMLSRTREIERELVRSERETRTLQKSLADARRDAEIDHLTGLPNRRAFEIVLKREYEAASEAHEPLCVAFCDIDNFKRINDLHGHEAGDRILRTIAQSLASISDDRCHVARHGGEEFVVLLRNRSIDEAFALLDEAREVMAARQLVNRATDVPFGRISFSAGLAEMQAFSSSREALRAADEALYRAKSSGRNRVFVASSPPPL